MNRVRRLRNCYANPKFKNVFNVSVDVAIDDYKKRHEAGEIEVDSFIQTWATISPDRKTLSTAEFGTIIIFALRLKITSLFTIWFGWSMRMIGKKICPLNNLSSN
jgi:hypothetical protein